MTVPAVAMQGISKRFGPVQALRGADFTLAPGELHALLGENGAGKSTLMHVLYGLTVADAGSVNVFGTEIPPGSTRAAIAAGIGLVQQHYSFVPSLTVAENVWLGRAGLRFDRRAATATVQRVGEGTGLALDPDAPAESLSPGLRQRLEIVKALAREIRVLVLDEPTSALTPSEVDELFGALRRLVAGGLAVVLITHKLRDVHAMADRVTVLRRGEVVLTGRASDHAAASLVAAMIGPGASGEAAAVVREEKFATPVREARSVLALSVRGLSVPGPAGRPSPVRDASFEVRAGEIVAIAAVDGNGQRELLRAVAGLVPHRGEAVITAGGSAGFIPDDRQHEGLILDFSLTDNLLLGAPGGFWQDRTAARADAAARLAAYAVRAPGPDAPAGTLSGGNQQKVVLARELSRRPAVLVADNPTRGLDVQATAEVLARLRRAAREDGMGVLLYSTDLDELLAVADRVAVMVSGAWRWVEPPLTREKVGAMMLGATA